MTWLQNRLAERSTWAAIGCLLTILGANLSPEAQRLLTEAGMAGVAFVLFILREKKENAPG